MDIYENEDGDEGEIEKQNALEAEISPMKDEMQVEITMENTHMVKSMHVTHQRKPIIHLFHNM